MAESIGLVPRIAGCILAGGLMRTISTCGKTQLVTTIDPNTKKPIITTVITEQPKKEIANVLELTPPIEDAINLGAIELDAMGDPFRRVHWDNDGDFSDPTKREYPYDQALRAYSRYKIGDYRYSVVENDNPHRLHVIVYDGGGGVHNEAIWLAAKKELLEKFKKTYTQKHYERQESIKKRQIREKATRDQPDKESLGVENGVMGFIYDGGWIFFGIAGFLYRRYKKANADPNPTFTATHQAKQQEPRSPKPKTVYNDKYTGPRS